MGELCVDGDGTLSGTVISLDIIIPSMKALLLGFKLGLDERLGVKRGSEDRLGVKLGSEERLESSLRAKLKTKSVVLQGWSGSLKSWSSAPIHPSLTRFLFQDSSTQVQVAPISGACLLLPVAVNVASLASVLHVIDAMVDIHVGRRLVLLHSAHSFVQKIRILPTYVHPRMQVDFVE